MLHLWRRQRRTAAAGLPVAIVGLLLAANAAPGQSTYEPEQLYRHFQKVAEAYDMRAGGTKLALRPQPLIHWQNTIRKQEQGALFMWHRGGRPQVLGSIFTYQGEDSVRCRHEMISLADAPLISKLDSAKVWSPQSAGVTWMEYNDAAAPTESQPRRLAQMRAIARQFSGTLHLPQQQVSNLTLIPQPLVRYQAADAGVIDGAVFSLAVVTDPEILLVIEGRKSKDGRTSWHYAAARAHYHHLKLRHKNQLVWEAPMVLELQSTQAGQLPRANDPYFIFFPPNPLPAPEDLR